MTAVQELIVKIKKRIPFFQYSVYQDDFDEAVEKEKEQIMFAYNDGVNDGNTQGLLGKEGNGNYVTLEEYYNQTYNKKEE